MYYQPAERCSGTFQQPVPEDDVRRICHRAFGDDAEIMSAVELTTGSYNNTFRVTIDGEQEVILRIAPEPSRQLRIEPELMRNEYAGAPYLAPILGLMPRVLAIDFTHQVIGRDYMFQTLLEGVVASEGLTAYPRHEWRSFFHQLGSIAHDIHAVRGNQFGRLAGPTYSTWSEAIAAWFEDAVADLTDASMDAKDVNQVMEKVDRGRSVLDQVTEPRLLHGDLWAGNLMILPGAKTPRIIGAFDCDRVWWGDPEADWPIFLARRGEGTERDAFWESYGPVASTSEARWRAAVYSARHTVALRLDYVRGGWHEDAQSTYDQLEEYLLDLNLEL